MPIIGIVLFIVTLFIVTLFIVTLSVILLFSSIAFLHAVGKTVAKPDLAI